MKITPIDIAHKTFGRKVMGFDPEEVMDFLRAIADELETITRDRNQIRESLREKELAIIEYRERDELLKSTITTATKMSDKIQSDAEREARLILGDARQQAEMIVRDARDSLKRIYQDISELKKVRLQFENNVRALVQSHLTMLDQGHKLMPNPDIHPSIQHEGFKPSAPPPSTSQEATIAANVTEAVRSSISKKPAPGQEEANSGPTPRF